MIYNLEWKELLSYFASGFTAPSFELFVKIACAWILCPGRHTITNIYILAEPSLKYAHDAYHRFFRDGVWEMDILWKLLAQLLITFFYPCGQIMLDLDDTLFHKTGRKIEGVGRWRDAVASTGLKKSVSALGLNLVVLTLNITLPYKKEPIGLPVLVRIHRKNGPSLIDIADEMIRTFSSWFPNRRLNVCADGFYATLAGHKLPNTSICSRIRHDAAIFELPQPPREDQRGRHRKKGDRLPTPKQLAKLSTKWSLATVNERGKFKYRLISCYVVLWYKVSPDAPILLVISRDPNGIERDDFFFSTDISAPPKSVISTYAGRWSIEDSFKNVKQFLGGQDPQSYKNLAPLRTASFSFFLYSLVWFWHIKNFASKQSWLSLPWYPQKTSPSFLDALASLRRNLWSQRVFSTSDSPSNLLEIINQFIYTLSLAA